MPLGSLRRVHDPVAERPVIRVPPAEPAIVEHEQLHAQVPRDRRDGDQALLVEVEVRSFPVVEQHGPLPVAPLPAGKPRPEQSVERVAHAAQTGHRVDRDRFGRGEGRPRLQQPVEAVGVKAEPKPDGGVVVDLGVGQEVAGVHEAEADGLAGVLRGAWSNERQERRLLEARGAAQALDDPSTRDEGCPDHVPLARPRAMERDELPVTILDVQGGAHEGRDSDGCGTLVADADAPGDRGVVAEQGQPDGRGESTDRVEKVDLQRVRLGVVLGVGARQPGQLRLAGEDAMRLVTQVEHLGPVRVADRESRQSVVPRVGCRQLEPDGVAHAVVEAGERSASQVAVVLPGCERGTQIQLTDVAVLEHRQDHAQAWVVQVPLPGAGVPFDGHRISLDAGWFDGGGALTGRADRTPRRPRGVARQRRRESVD